MTRKRVAIFSGASRRARRTGWNVKASPSYEGSTDILSLGDISEKTSEAESKRLIYCPKISVRTGSFRILT
jgi:hypothetical protein